jgi:hypothetical protein
MDWNKYKLLTEEEREEYDFRFTKKSFQITKFSLWTISLVYIFGWIFFGTMFSYLSLANIEISQETILAFGEGILGMIYIGFIIPIWLSFTFLCDAVLYLIQFLIKNEWINKRIITKRVNGEYIYERNQNE